MNLQILEQIRLLKPELKKQFYVEEIAVFGSVVRNEANESSDLDILVKLEKPLGFKFISLINFLESNLKEKVDVVTDKAIRPKMKQQIFNEAVFI